MRRRGFTLIEIMLVVILLGILAGATVLSLTEQVRHSKASDAVSRIEHADATARLAARRTGPCVLRFDLDAQSLRRIDDWNGKQRPAHAVNVPEGYRIERIAAAPGALATDASQPDGDGIQYTSGVVDIACGGNGRSGTYAVRINVQDGGEEFWLVVSGLTGQVTRTDDDATIDNLFAMLARGGPDAD